MKSDVLIENEHYDDLMGGLDVLLRLATTAVNNAQKDVQRAENLMARERPEFWRKAAAKSVALTKQKKLIDYQARANAKLSEALRYRKEVLTQIERIQAQKMTVYEAVLEGKKMSEEAGKNG